MFTYFSSFFLSLDVHIYKNSIFTKNMYTNTHIHTYTSQYRWLIPKLECCQFVEMRHFSIDVGHWKFLVNVHRCRIKTKQKKNNHVQREKKVTSDLNFEKKKEIIIIKNCGWGRNKLVVTKRWLPSKAIVLFDLFEIVKLSS